MKRDEAILSLSPLVHSILGGVGRRYCLKRADHDDLRAALWIAAIRAVDSHRDGSVSLKTYAAYRLKFAAVDFFRDADHLNRAHRRAVKAGSEPAPRLTPLNGCNPGHCDSAFAATNRRLDLQAMIRAARLSPAELAVVRGLLQDVPIRSFMAAFGVNESRLSQIKTSALLKMRAAASS